MLSICDVCYCGQWRASSQYCACVTVVSPACADAERKVWTTFEAEESDGQPTTYYGFVQSADPGDGENNCPPAPPPNRLLSSRYCVCAGDPELLSKRGLHVFYPRQAGYNNAFDRMPGVNGLRGDGSGANDWWEWRWDTMDHCADTPLRQRFTALAIAAAHYHDTFDTDLLRRDRMEEAKRWRPQAVQSHHYPLLHRTPERARAAPLTGLLSKWGRAIVKVPGARVQPVVDDTAGDAADNEQGATNGKWAWTILESDAVASEYGEPPRRRRRRSPPRSSRWARAPTTRSARCASASRRRRPTSRRPRRRAPARRRPTPSRRGERAGGRRGEGARTRGWGWARPHGRGPGTVERGIPLTGWWRARCMLRSDVLARRGASTCGVRPRRPPEEPSRDASMWEGRGRRRKGKENVPLQGAGQRRPGR